MPALVDLCSLSHGRELPVLPMPLPSPRAWWTWGGQVPSWLRPVSKGLSSGTAGHVGGNGWDFNILNAHSTGDENSLWRQQAGLPPGSAMTSRLLVLKEWIVKQWMHFSHCWWAHWCWCILLLISEHPCSVESLCYRISFCDIDGLEKKILLLQKIATLGRNIKNWSISNQNGTFPQLTSQGNKLQSLSKEWDRHHFLKRQPFLFLS